MAGSFIAANRELARHKLDLVGVQEVRWSRGGIVRGGDYSFSTEKEMRIINCEQDSLYITECYQQLRE
jgi:hypothetical protein